MTGAGLDLPEAEPVVGYLHPGRRVASTQRDGDEALPPGCPRSVVEQVDQCPADQRRVAVRHRVVGHVHVHRHRVGDLNQLHALLDHSCQVELPQAWREVLVGSYDQVRGSHQLLVDRSQSSVSFGVEALVTRHLRQEKASRDVLSQIMTEPGQLGGAITRRGSAPGGRVRSGHGGPPLLRTAIDQVRADISPTTSVPRTAESNPLTTLRCAPYRVWRK